MTAVGGYAGKIAFVDLTRREVRQETLDLEQAKRFIGGAGLTYSLIKDIFTGTGDPLGPDNPIIIGAGPLVGTPTPSAAKFQVTTQFPNPASSDGRCFIGSASSGSRRFALMLKNAGFDAVVITGRSESPCYLLIDNQDIKIKDASLLWGKSDIYQTTVQLIQAHPDSGVIAIGAAGENLVRFSLAITDNTSTLGRNGLGAVFGSKNLKAVVTRGSQGVTVKNPQALLRVVSRIHQEIQAHPMTRLHQELGVHANWEVYRITMNPGSWSLDKWNRYYGSEAARSAILENLPCTACLLGCRSSFKFDSSVGNSEITHTGTFLHLANIGQVSGLTNWHDAAMILHRCNQVGMSVVEFRGIIRYLSLAAADHPEVKELKLEEGLPAYQRLLDMIIHRRGIGEILANGWVAMAEEFGKEPGDYLSLVKGAACTYDARATKLDAPRFNIVVNPRGAMHGQAHSTTSVPLRKPEDIIKELKHMGMADEDIIRIIDDQNLNIGRLTRHVQDSGMAMDSLGVCVMYGIPGFLHLKNLSKIYSAVTGWETSPHDLKQSGERAFNLLKILNTWAGFGRADDTFPKIWLQAKNTPDGIEYLDDYYRNKHLTETDLEQVLTDYYVERGWDPQSGLPKQETIDRLL